MEGLTDLQRRVLDYLSAFTGERGYPPTVREVGARFNIRSPKNAAKHLLALERKGFIRRIPGLSRGIDVIKEAGNMTGSIGARVGAVVGVEASESFEGGISIPLVGSVKAGSPHLAVEDMGERVMIDPSLFGNTAPGSFFLTVEGESMIDAGIHEGDLVLVDPGAEPSTGEIVVAMLSGEATLKRYIKRRSGITLKAENEEIDDIEVKGSDIRSGLIDFSVLGKVKGVVKRF